MRLRTGGFWRRAAGALLAAGAALGLGQAAGHGINGHVHVTGWALEALPPGELRRFFADAELRDVAHIGAAFPDTGYAIGDPYGELAHWEPFIDVYVQWIRERFGPGFEGPDARRHIAFLLGAASHGLQDEIFDSIFLHYVQQEDGGGQDEADPGTDAFLFTDGHLHLQPPPFVPAEDLVGVFARAHGHEVRAQTMRDGMARVHLLVIDKFFAVAPGLDARHRPQIPWTAAHYMDPSVPGSLTSEVPATAAYMLALWERLHGRFEPQAFVGHPYPAPRRRLRGNAADRVDSWITLVFGTGAFVGSLDAETVALYDAEGVRVPADVRHTRWAGRPGDTTRLVQIRPRVDLVPDSTYEVRLEPGIRHVDGRVTEARWTWRFRSACGEDACGPDPDGGPSEPERVPYDGGAPEPPVPDAGTPDATPALPDAAGPPDAMPAADASARDDATVPPADAARPPADATRVPDAAPASADAEPAPPSGSGGAGGCTQAPGRRGPLTALALVLAAALAARRRPRRA